MLKTLFIWLDHHSYIYWFLTAGPTLLLLWRIKATVRGDVFGPAEVPRRTNWGDALVIFLFLLAWRWPFLLVAGEFNPDESQLIAGAITLAHDPVFWRSVDGTTSGP